MNVYQLPKMVVVTILFSLLSMMCSAQVTITDSGDGTPVAFAQVVDAKGKPIGVSDVNGRVNLHGHRAFSVHHVAYETASFDLSHSHSETLRLRPLKVSVNEVVVAKRRPEYIRIKGYFRSYQTNDSLLKYYMDGVVEYYIRLKNGSTDVKKLHSRYLRNEDLVGKDRKRAFSYSDDGTNRPWIEGTTLMETVKRGFQMRDSDNLRYVLWHGKKVGMVVNNEACKEVRVDLDMLPSMKKTEYSLWGFNRKDIYYTLSESYRQSEDYYSFKDLLSQKEYRSYYFWYKKDSKRQLIDVVSELYVTDREYLTKAEMKDKRSMKSSKDSPSDDAKAIEMFCEEHHIPRLPAPINTERDRLSYYDPANLNVKVKP